MVMKLKSKPSTANCNEDLYSLYLLSDPKNTSCTRLSSIMRGISHDSVNRFLERERFDPADLFHEVKGELELSGGFLSVDDSVLDKPYMNKNKASLIGLFWSGKHKRPVKGINLITLFYTDPAGVSVPINYRIYDASEGKTKNDYFLEMIEEIIQWGVRPAWITGDCWYSSLTNLKFLRSKNLAFMFGIETNRTVSIERGQYIQIQKLEDWDDDQKTVYLKDYGMVQVFRKIYKNVYRYYIISVPELTRLPSINKNDFERTHAAHWTIERYHRAIKQVCHIEHFQVRGEHQIKNHIFCALKGFVSLELMRVKEIICHWYEVQRDLFIDSIRRFIAASTQS